MDISLPGASGFEVARAIHELDGGRWTTADAILDSTLGAASQFLGGEFADVIQFWSDLRGDLRADWTRALDRVLMHEHYIVPHWNLSAWRIAYWNQFGRPKITPAYNIGYDSWWALRPGEKAPDVASEGSVQ